MPTPDPDLRPRTLRLRGLVRGVETTFELAPGSRLVGSSRACDVVLPVRGVSRRHAALEVTAGGLTVEDRGSLNGTWVEERRVERAPVAPGDEVRFGPVRLRLEALEPEDAELAIAFADPSSEGPAEMPGAHPGRSALSFDETTQLAAPQEPGAGLVFPDGYRALQAPAMAALYRQMSRLVRGDLPVLILGETGVGKEQIARTLHISGERRHGPFVAVNCAAIPAELLEAEMFGIGKGVATGVEPRPGKFQLADGGTLFLDEIGELQLELQAKLLRAIQEGEIHPVGGAARQVSVRIVAATNADLKRRVENDRFRRDLYYRLAGSVLEVPPLRRCRDDVPALVEHFFVRFARRAGLRLRGLTVKAMERLVAHDWPGNVRELEHEVRRFVDQSDDGRTIDSTALSPEVTGGGEATASVPVPSLLEVPSAGVKELESLALEPRLRSLEEALIREALRRSQGNQTRAAELLEITRNGLAKKLKRLGISADRG